MAEYIDKDKLIDRFDELCNTICQYSKKQRAVMCSSCELGIAFDVVDDFPTEDVQPVTHCKDCVYRPYYEPSDSKSASDLVFPDYRFNLCPCRVEDFWYSWMPDDDWFCAYGKRKDGET